MQLKLVRCLTVRVYAVPATLKSLALMTLLLPTVPAMHAQVPDEVTQLSWCDPSANCLTWTDTATATAYDVYRGEGPALGGLLDTSPDACRVGSYGTTSSGPALFATPAPGELRWYLVTAVNASGQGTVEAPLQIPLEHGPFLRSSTNGGGSQKVAKGHVPSSSGVDRFGRARASPATRAIRFTAMTWRGRIIPRVRVLPRRPCRGRRPPRSPRAARRGPGRRPRR